MMEKAHENWDLHIAIPSKVSEPTHIQMTVDGVTLFTCDCYDPSMVSDVMGNLAQFVQRKGLNNGR